MAKPGFRDIPVLVESEGLARQEDSIFFAMKRAGSHAPGCHSRAAQGLQRLIEMAAPNWSLSSAKLLSKLQANVFCYSKSAELLR